MIVIGNTPSLSAAPVQTGQLVPNPPPASSGGLSFGDVLDALNPLQHIPVVSSLYRAATGSQISTASQIAGETLYGAALGGASLIGGALVGFASSLADVAVKQTTGEDISQHVVATLSAATNSVTASPTTGNTINTGQLIPSANGVVPSLPPIPSPAAQLSAQVTNAANAIIHPTVNSERTNAEYQRAQAFDAMNKYLVKMAV